MSAVKYLADAGNVTAERMTYYGSTTSVAGGGSLYLGMGVPEWFAVAAAIVGIIAAVIGVYFQYLKHVRGKEQAKREEQEHALRMKVLQRGIDQQNDFAEQTTRRLDSAANTHSHDR